MASAQFQKPTNEICLRVREEHKFSHKITEMTAWGSRVFGHKQQEHQAITKHCTTCQCTEPKKDIKPACANKKENATSVVIKETNPRACKETKEKKKDEHASIFNKDVKRNTHMEVKKKEKQHTTSSRTACTDMKKEKEHHANSKTTDSSNTMIKKEHKDEPANHCFSSMADHWKERIMMMRKVKDAKSKYSSSSSSDSEDDACDKKKKDKRHYQETRAAAN